MPLTNQQKIIGVAVVASVVVIIIIAVVKSKPVKKCNLVCQNGGSISADCTSCTCQSPWKGNTCQSCGLTCNPGYFPDVSCVNCIFKCPDFKDAMGKDVTKTMQTLSAKYPALTFSPIIDPSNIIRNVVQNRVRLWYNKDTNLITREPKCG